MDAPPAGDGRVLAILEGLQALSRALTIFSEANYRCMLVSAGNVAQAATRLQSLNESNTRQTGAGQRPQLFIDEIDVSPSMRRAGDALQKRRFYQAGLTFAQVFVATSGEMDDVPSLQEKWAPIDAQGRIKGEDELADHWRKLQTKRLEALLDEERRLSAGMLPKMPSGGAAGRGAAHEGQDVLVEGPAGPGAGGRGVANSLCCCCWSDVTTQQERMAEAAHLY